MRFAIIVCALTLLGAILGGCSPKETNDEPIKPEGTPVPVAPESRPPLNERMDQPKKGRH